MYVDGREVDVQYSNWRSSDPDYNDDCVQHRGHNTWRSDYCDRRERYVCQS